MKKYQNKDFLYHQYIEKQKSIIQIAKENNFGPTTVFEWIKFFSIPTRPCKTTKYNLNHCFFKKIDSQQKAYWLGFIFADGCVHSSNNRIILSQNNKQHLQKWINAIEFNGIVRKCKPGNFYVSLFSSQIKKDLAKYGIIPAKSRSNTVPKNIPQKYLRHFLRGIFDGDGCVGIVNTNGYNYIYISFTNQTPVIEWIRQQLLSAELLPNKNKVYYQKNTCSFIRVVGKPANQILDYLYKDAYIFLERKYEIYRSFTRR